MRLRYLPWRRVKSWRCTACGECCSRYAVPLSAGEYARLVSRFGDWVVRLKLGRPYLRRVSGRCVFLSGRLCSLQGSLKPYACRIFPFLVRDREKKPRKEAEFWYGQSCFYVYLSPGCGEVRLGTPERWFVEQVIPEAIELHLNRSMPLRWLTSQAAPLPPEHYAGVGDDAPVVPRYVSAVSVLEQLSSGGTPLLRRRNRRRDGTVAAG
ncbi:MAG: YkgJ family cysteine cluster protein [Euryarchaeota archaeon]|nr:YkgJ family cysteine cluster protein [Euryarchaeota archaeon]